MTLLSHLNNHFSSIWRRGCFFIFVLFLFHADRQALCAEDDAPSLEYLTIENHLNQVGSQNTFGDVRGLLIPNRSDNAGNQVSAFAYDLLQSPRFDTVILLYSAPPQTSPYASRDDGGNANTEKQSVVLPLSAHIQTPLGPLPVDVKLRDYILAFGKDYRLDDATLQSSVNMQLQLSFLRYMTEDKKINTLPIGLYTQNFDLAKDVAQNVLDALNAIQTDTDNVLILISGNLSKGLTRAKADLVDSQMISLLEGMNADSLRSYMDQTIIDEASLDIFPDAVPILAGTLILNQGFASHGVALVYANTGQIPMSKESKYVTGFAAMAFSYGKKPKQRISEDRTLAARKELTEDLMKHLLENARLSIRNAMDPASPSPQPLPAQGDTSWMDSFKIFGKKEKPIFVSIYKDRELIGQSGTLKALGPIEEAVKYHSVRAALHDPFRPAIKFDELANVKITVSVPVAQDGVSNINDIVPSRDGVHLQYRNRAQTFLPDAWKRYPNRTVLLSEMASQIGLPPWAWNSSSAELSVFQAVMITEEAPQQ